MATNSVTVLPTVSLTLAKESITKSANSGRPASLRSVAAFAA